MRPNNHGSAPLNVATVAAAGSTQATATAISVNAAPGFILVSGGDDIVGVRLPPASRGKLYHIKNLGTGGLNGTLNVYPATGDSLNALSANSPLVMASLKAATFIAANSTTWYTVPLLPS